MGAEKTMFTLVLLASCILFSGFAALPQDDFVPVADPGAVLERLNERAGAIETIKSRFIQEKRMEFLDEILISHGRFWFRKENSLRWAYEEPFEYAIIIHKGSFHIKDGGEVSSYDIESNAVFREINDLIISLVQGKVMQEERFAIDVLESKKYYQVKLVPREEQMRDVISDMEILFDKADLSVTRIVMKENAQDYTVITLIDKQFNESIPDPVFGTAY
jgi:outer membrane lipoprotein-sorting protein